MQAGKKIVAGMLALALTIQGVPMQRGTAVQAAGQTTETAPLQGTDGAITWKLTEQTPQQGWSQGDKKAYKLTITGKGVMPGYMHMSDGVNTPWQPYNDQIQTIAVAKGVTRVSEHAFEGMGELTSVTLPSTVTQVSREAFMYCQKLEKITLPEALENIGDRAFNYCRALKSIVVPDQVTTIGSLAFAGCTSLESVSLGESVAQVQGSLFHECGKLSTLTVAHGNASMRSEDNVLYNKDMSLLIRYAAGKSDTKFCVPGSVKTIGVNAITHCSNLAELQIPSSVTKMDDYAVYYNSALSKLFFEGNAPKVSVVTSHTGIIGGNPQVYVYTVYNGAIRHNGKTGTDANKDITLYKTASSTGWGEGWSTISQKSDETNQYSKGYGFTLQNFSLTDTDTADGTFGSLKWHYRDDIKELSFSGSGSISDFSLSALPKWNGGQGRSFRQSIKTIDASKATITAVGNYAFYNADQLEKVTFGSGLKRVGKYAFADCTALKNFPAENATSIEEGAFAGDTSLTGEVDMTGAQVIGASAMEGASGITDIRLGAKLTSIEARAFANCKKLNGVILPLGIKTLKKRAFYGCSSLEAVNIPEGFTGTEAETFGNCTALKKVYFTGSMPEQWNEDTFAGCSSTLNIYYNSGKTGWSDSVENGTWQGYTASCLTRHFQRGKNTYSFEDTAKNYGYSNAYKIPQARYQSVLKNAPLAAFYAATEPAYQGNAFGMAASVLDFYEGDNLKVSSYDSKAKTVYEIQTPGQALTELIEKYQVTQYAQPVSDALTANQGKYLDMVKKIARFSWSGGRKVDAAGEAVVICVYKGSKAHALVPLDVTITSGGNYLVTVYDSSNPADVRYMSVSKDLSCVHYTVGSEDYTKASFVSYSVLKQAAGGSSTSYQDKMTVAVNRQNITIKDSQDRAYTEISGAYEQIPAAGSSMADFSGIKRFVLPQGSYDVKNTPVSQAVTEHVLAYLASDEVYVKMDASDSKASVHMENARKYGYYQMAVTPSVKNGSITILIMNKAGKTKEIVVQGGAAAAKVYTSGKVQLTLTSDATKVTVDGKSVEPKTSIELAFETTTPATATPSPTPTATATATAPATATAAPTKVPAVTPTTAPTKAPAVTPTAPTKAPAVTPTATAAVTPPTTDAATATPTATPSTTPTKPADTDKPTAGGSDVQPQESRDNYVLPQKPVLTLKKKTEVKKPARVKIRSVKKKKGSKLCVKLKKQENALRYQILYGTSKKFKKAKKVKTSSTQVILKIKKGHTYYIKARAYNGAGYGAYSKVKQIKVK